MKKLKKKLHKTCIQAKRMFAFVYKFKRKFGKWCDTEKYGLYSSYSAKKNKYSSYNDDFAGEMA